LAYQRLNMKQFSLLAVFAAAISLGSALPGAPLATSVASAQTAAHQVGPSPKGTIGLGLVGAELGLVIPAAAGLDDTWALIVFPVVGGVGGALAGHYLLDDGNRTFAIGALALGVALIVPSIVITLSATAYNPDDEGGVEGSDSSGAAAGGGSGDAADDGSGDASGDTSVEVDSGEQAALHRRHLARAGSGLFRLSEEGLMLGVPGLSVLPENARAELSFMRTNEGTELRLSLVSGVF